MTPAADEAAPLWGRAFTLSTPILAGYVAIGTAFGVLWVQQGLAPLGAPLLGLLVYAGAAQFMAAGMLAAGQGPLEIALATLILNSRHAVYGLAFLDRFPSWSAAKAYFAFALTDETYALLSATPPLRTPRQDQGMLWRLALLNQVYWVGGCSLGAILGTGALPGLAGLDFALPALFVVLLIEQVRTPGRRLPALVGAAAAFAALALFGNQNALLPALAAALLAVTLVGRRNSRC